ncbi:hypothetical protein ACFL50_06590 [Candidatus Latescibacterota bacterium]
MSNKLGDIDVVSAPFKSLSFFKLHYFVIGMILVLFFPDRFMYIFEPARGYVIMFCLSWIGFYYGCGLELRAHQKFPTKVILFNIFEPVIIFFFVAFIGILFFYFKYDGWEYTDIAFIIAVFCSFTIFRRRGILKREESSSHHEVLDNLLPVGDIFPVIALCIVGAIMFGDRTMNILSHSFTGLFSTIILIILFGAAVGALFNMLISEAKSSDSISIIMVGGTAFCGGIVYYFSFSPLFIGMVSGAFLINATLKRLQTLEALNNTNEIIEKLYMFILGTIIAPIIVMLKVNVFLIGFSAIALFVFRSSLKYILCYLWSSHFDYEKKVSPLMWIGLTGQGILASAATYECSLYADLMPAIIMLLVTLLVCNQLAIGFYVWRKG